MKFLTKPDDGTRIPGYTMNLWEQNHRTGRDTPHQNQSLETQNVLDRYSEFWWST